jgi:hypothetical protein
MLTTFVPEVVLVTNGDGREGQLVLVLDNVVSVGGPVQEMGQVLAELQQEEAKAAHQDHHPAVPATQQQAGMQ